MRFVPAQPIVNDEGAVCIHLVRLNVPCTYCPPHARDIENSEFEKLFVPDDSSYLAAQRAVAAAKAPSVVLKSVKP